MNKRINCLIDISQRISFASFPTFLCLTILFFVMVCANCTGSSPTAGVTEGGNTDVATASVSGAIVNEKGIKIVDAKISLRPVDYLPDTSGNNPDLNSGGFRYKVFDVQTDHDGAFHIDSVLPGTYRLVVMDRESLGIMKTITVSGDRYELASPVKVKKLGKIAGNVVFPDTTSQVVYIRMYGVERVNRVVISKNQKKFSVDKIPGGKCRVDIFPGKKERFGSKQIEDIEIAPGGETQLDTITFDTFENEDYSRWSYSQKIVCNTSRLDLGELPILNFPLLIELDEHNFDFDRAQRNGDDLRFSSSTGKHLFYEIESFDAQSRSAAVWVLIDSIKSRGPTAFNMHWGNPDAVNHSLGSRVFPQTQGFGAVFHLSEKGDVFTNAVNGTSSGRGKLFDGSEAVKGVAGGADSLDGRNDRIDIDSIAGTGQSQLTLSAWVKVNRWESKTYIVSKCLSDPGPVKNSFAIVLENSQTISFRVSIDGKVYKVISPFEHAGRWAHVAGVYDGSSVYLYVNGKQVDSLPASGLIDDSFMPVVIGYCLEGPQNHLNGVVDEFRIEQIARNSDWLRLTYENQLNDANFLSFD